MTPNFFNLSYLAEGSAIQRKGFQAIQRSGVMETLRTYTPVLAGTLPLDIFIDGSDLDILLSALDLSPIKELLIDNFRAYHGFNVRSIIIHSNPSVIANFQFEGFHFELFAQSVPTHDQTAYRHMVNEFEILRKSGTAFKEEVIALKKQGIKTEPAFARLLHLEGDPYEAILKYHS